MEATRATTLEPYLAARDVAALWMQLHHHLEPYGIDRVFHAGARRRPANGELIACDTVVLSSYGADFDAFFVRDGGFSSDVTTQWALDSEGSVSWHLTARLKARGQLTARQLVVHERTQELGVTAGIDKVDPSRYSGETFELFSFPSFETGRREVLRGAEIGLTKQAVEPVDVLLCKIVPHISRVWVVPENKRQIASSE